MWQCQWKGTVTPVFSNHFLLLNQMFEGDVRGSTFTIDKTAELLLLCHHNYRYTGCFFEGFQFRRLWPFPARLWKYSVQSSSTSIRPHCWSLAVANKSSHRHWYNRETTGRFPLTGRWTPACRLHFGRLNRCLNRMGGTTPHVGCESVACKCMGCTKRCLTLSSQSLYAHSEHDNVHKCNNILQRKTLDCWCSTFQWPALCK